MSQVSAAPARLIVIGAIAGLVVGLLGVGASTVVVPALALWIGVSEHKAHGTTTAVVLPTAVISALLYAWRGMVQWKLALYLGIGGAVGAYLGTLLMPHLSPIWLRRIFAVTALLAGWQMLRRA
jgi:uncharacterized membrane protein YfcA